jgi:hypothetical protein
MAKTWRNLIDEARTILQDTDSDGSRLEDAAYIDFLNRGLQAMATIRPDAFWDTFATDNIVVPEVVSADLATTFPIDMIFYPPLVHYVAGAAEILDDEFSTEGRAMALLSTFRQSLVAL